MNDINKINKIILEKKIKFNNNIFLYICYIKQNNYELFFLMSVSFQIIILKIQTFL